MALQFPTTQELNFVIRNRSGANAANFIGNSFCPIVPVYAKDIEYDVLEPAFGMTQAHQIGTDPRTVQIPKMGTKRTGTAYWKETLPLGEEKLLYARLAGTLNERAGRDLVFQGGLQLDTRLDTRIEWLRWKAVIDGLLDIEENNVKYLVDYKLPAKNDISAAATKWSDPTKSDPAALLTGMVQGYRGTGAAARKVFMNSFTAGQAVQSAKFIELLKQSNFVGMLSPLDPTPALKLMIPKVEFVVYDEGYLDEEKNFQMFVPDGEIVMVGDYPGDKVMDFASTISLHNGGIEKPQPGKFSIVEDKSQAAKNPHVDITVGIYGLPRIFHPDWIKRAKVS